LDVLLCYVPIVMMYLLLYIYTYLYKMDVSDIICTIAIFSVKNMSKQSPK